MIECGPWDNSMFEGYDALQCLESGQGITHSSYLKLRG